MQNDNSTAPVSRANKSKSNYKLKVSCLLEWLRDHKKFKPKPSFHPENIDNLGQKFTVRKTK